MTMYLWHECLYVIFVQKKQMLEHELQRFPNAKKIMDLLTDAERVIKHWTKKLIESEIKLTEYMKGLSHHTH